jgi:hypothetical protein
LQVARRYVRGLEVRRRNRLGNCDVRQEEGGVDDDRVCIAIFVERAVMVRLVNRLSVRPSVDAVFGCSRERRVALFNVHGFAVFGANGVLDDGQVDGAGKLKRHAASDDEVRRQAGQQADSMRQAHHNGQSWHAARGAAMSEPT